MQPRFLTIIGDISSKRSECIIVCVSGNGADAPTMPRGTIKRIQLNARPSDAYNDGSALIRTGPERSDPASNAIIER